MWCGTGNASYAYSIGHERQAVLDVRERSRPGAGVCLCGVAVGGTVREQRTLGEILLISQFRREELERQKRGGRRSRKLFLPLPVRTVCVIISTCKQLWYTIYLLHVSVYFPPNVLLENETLWCFVFVAWDEDGSSSANPSSCLFSSLSEALSSLLYLSSGPPSAPAGA